MGETTSVLPLLTSVFPIIGALGVWIVGKRSSCARDILSMTIAALTLLLAGIIFWQTRESVIIYQIPWFLAFGLSFRVDFIGGLFCLVVALVWFLTTVFAREYMALEHNQTRFFSFFILTLGSTCGVFLAGDLFSLFLFFEMMTFAAYVLVVHEQNDEAIEAGNVYLYMSIFGGLCLLAIIFLLQHINQSTAYLPVLDQIVAAGINPWLVFMLMIFGFGVKAGMIPLHIWLPQAHPVAPSPASALLSALMIKAGVYGFIRCLLTILTPVADQSLWVYVQDFGYVFLIIGAVTMVGGGLMALINSSMKRILAYSSISQMGYILYSLGIGVFMGDRGAVGIAGAWIHMLSHAVYKSFLFLAVGAVFMKTRDLDTNHLGGLYRKMPWAFGFMLIAAAGITGIPGFNGYLSKILIHEAVLEAIAVRQLPSLVWLERLFVLTGGITAAYITKLWISIFLGNMPQRWNYVKDISITHKLVFAAYTLIIIGIGIPAQRIVNQLVIPALGGFNFYEADIAHLSHVPFWHASELTAPLIAYAIGLTVLIIWMKLRFKVHIPGWLSVEYLIYRPLTAGVLGGIRFIGGIHFDPPDLSKLVSKMRNVKEIRLPQLNLHKFHFDQLKNNKKIKRPRVRRHFKIDNYRQKMRDYKQSVQYRVQRLKPVSQHHTWDTESLSFDSLLVAVVIALLLLVFILTYFT